MTLKAMRTADSAGRSANDPFLVIQRTADDVYRALARTRRSVADRASHERSFEATDIAIDANARRSFRRAAFLRQASGTASASPNGVWHRRPKSGEVLQV